MKKLFLAAAVILGTLTVSGSAFAAGLTEELVTVEILDMGTHCNEGSDVYVTDITGESLGYSYETINQVLPGRDCTHESEVSILEIEGVPYAAE